GRGDASGTASIDVLQIRSRFAACLRNEHDALPIREPARVQVLKARCRKLARLSRTRRQNQKLRRIPEEARKRPLTIERQCNALAGSEPHRTQRLHLTQPELPVATGTFILTCQQD